MGKTYKKRDFPVEDIRKYLEPGLTVLVSSQWKAGGRTLHYRGDTAFMIPGKNVSYPGKFKPQHL